MNKSTLAFAVTVFLAVIAHSRMPSEPTHIPATALAAANAGLIARVDRALRGYVGACSTGDEKALARIVTSDAVVEHELEEPGTFLEVEAAALTACLLIDAKAKGTGAHISKLWIFPTPESNAVFVRYTIGSDVQDSGQLAIIEMRGERISKMRNFRKHDIAQR